MEVKENDEVLEKKEDTVEAKEDEMDIIITEERMEAKLDEVKARDERGEQNDVLMEEVNNQAEQKDVLMEEDNNQAELKDEEMQDTFSRSESSDFNSDEDEQFLPGRDDELDFEVSNMDISWPRNSVCFSNLAFNNYCAETSERGRNRRVNFRSSGS